MEGRAAAIRPAARKQMGESLRKEGDVVEMEGVWMKGVVGLETRTCLGHQSPAPDFDYVRVDGSRIG